MALAGTPGRARAPETLWTAIEGALRSQAASESRRAGDSRLCFLGWRPLAVGMALLVVLLGIVVARRFGTPSWRIASALWRGARRLSSSTATGRRRFRFSSRLAR